MGVSVWELMDETWFGINKMSILTNCIPLQWLPKLKHDNENVSILDKGFKFFRKVMDNNTVLFEQCLCVMI